MKQNDYHVHIILYRKWKNMASTAPVPFTVIKKMTACGIDLASVKISATEIFMDYFETCKDISNDDIDDKLKTFYILTVAQGQIHLMPESKQNIKAFNQWVKDQFRLGVEATTLEFTVNTSAELLHRVKTHKIFVARSYAIALAEKPEKLTRDKKWEDWAPSFLNYLRAIPVQDGVPLKCIVRNNEMPDAIPNVDFLDDYIINAPLTGQAFTIDAAEVHTFIVNFINQNDESKSIIKIFEN